MKGHTHRAGPRTNKGCSITVMLSRVLFLVCCKRVTEATRLPRFYIRRRNYPGPLPGGDIARAVKIGTYLRNWNIMCQRPLRCRKVFPEIMSYIYFYAPLAHTPAPHDAACPTPKAIEEEWTTISTRKIAQGDSPGCFRRSHA